jgi:hypothetical protein
MSKEIKISMRISQEDLEACGREGTDVLAVTYERMRKQLPPNTEIQGVIIRIDAITDL